MDTGLFFALNGLAGRAARLDAALVWGATWLPAAMLAAAAAWSWLGGGDDRGQRQRLAVYAGIAAAVAVVLAEAVSHLWYRPRPFVDHAVHLLLAHAPDASFPSSHAAACFALATPFLLARRRVGWLLLACAAATALARVAVGVHYPSDVLGGAVLGMAAGWAVWRVRERIEPPLAHGLAVAKRFGLA